MNTKPSIQHGEGTNEDDLRNTAGISPWCGGYVAHRVISLQLTRVELVGLSRFPGSSRRVEALGFAGLPCPPVEKRWWSSMCRLWMTPHEIRR